MTTNGPTRRTRSIRGIFAAIILSLPITCPGACVVAIGLEYLRRMAFPLSDADILLGQLPDGCEVVRSDARINRKNILSDDDGIFEVRYRDAASLQSLLEYLEVIPIDPDAVPVETIGLPIAAPTQAATAADSSPDWWPSGESLRAMEEYGIDWDTALENKAVYVDRSTRTVYISVSQL